MKKPVDLWGDEFSALEIAVERDRDRRNELIKTLLMGCAFGLALLAGSAAAQFFSRGADFGPISSGSRGCSFTVSPDVGAADGGVTLTLTGSGLAGVTAVTVGGQTCSGVSAAETVVTCTSPALLLGAYDVVATRATDSCTAVAAFSACDDTTNLISGPGDMQGGELFGQPWWNAFGNGVAAPTVTAYYDTDPAGGNGAMHVQFAAVPSSSQESTLYQIVPACIGTTCTYSIFVRATPGGSGPSSGNLPIAMADNGGDGHAPQNCAFTTSWSRCELTFVNGGSYAAMWLGFASYGAGYSGTGPAMDLELFGPKVELGSTAGPYECVPYVTTLATIDAGFIARDGAGLVAMADGRLLMLGGWNTFTQSAWNDTHTTNEVLESLDQGATWSTVLAFSSDPPQTNDAGGAQRWRRRHSFGAVAANISGSECIYVVGGDELDDVFGTAPQDVWRSCDNARNWEQRTADAGYGSRVLFNVWTMNGKLYLATGQGTPEADSGFVDVWESADEGATWSQTKSDMGFATHGSVIQPVVTAGKVWSIGGQLYNNSGAHTRYNDVWVWDGGNSGTWTNATPDAGFAPRAYLNTLMFDGKLWVLRGNYGDSNTQDTNDAWHSSDGVTWSRNNWSAGTVDTHAGSAAVSGSTLVIAGGVNPGNAVWRVRKGSVMW